MRELRIEEVDKEEESEDISLGFLVKDEQMWRRGGGEFGKKRQKIEDV